MSATVIFVLSSLLLTASASDRLLPLRRRASPNPAPLTATKGSYYGHFFDVEVTFGNQTFFMLADTGSSDSWLTVPGYQCLNKTNGSVLPQGDCGFAKASYVRSPTFEPIANETLGVLYGAGVALGTLGYEDVTLAGVTAHRQIIGLVDKVTSSGDGLNSGYLGLGHSWLTSAHPGTVPPPANASLLLNKVLYDPLLVSMYKQGSIPGWFSMSLERLPPNASTGPGGYLGLGVLPPVAYDNSSWAHAPVEVTEVFPLELTNGAAGQITEWTLSVERVTWSSVNGSSSTTGGGSSSSSSTTNSTRFQAVVDSGNYYCQIPDAIAAPVHAAYSPPAKYDATLGIAVVSCDAKPPAFSLTIAGKTFHLQPEDMILQLPDGRCTATVLPSPPGIQGLQLNFLGDVFMNNVVSVFDYERNEMRFAARTSGGAGVPGPSAPSGGASLSTPQLLMTGLAGIVMITVAM